MRLTLDSFIAGLVALPAMMCSFAQAGGVHTETEIDAPLIWSDVAIDASSGIQQSSPTEETLAWYSMVQAPNANWLRLEFSDDSKLALAANDTETDSYIRITSLFDGAEQILNAQSLAQWHNTSAYFNGDMVIIELISGKNNSTSSISIKSTQVGEDIVVSKSQCGNTDDRIASIDPRVCRITPVGCTGWMINDANHMFLSAGHCPGNTFSVVQFNVPLSQSSGTIVNPPPEDQYPIDTTSVQYSNGGIGNDWCYFGVFPNSNSGLTPFQKQQAAFTLAAPPAASGKTIRITGFGVDTGNANQTNQTHTGAFTSNSGTTLRYTADTTGGNSGSPVIVEGLGVAVGIHTNGGCTTSGGSNSGTSYNQTALRNALINPTGACKSIAFTYPNGLPTQFSTVGGDQITVTFTSPTSAAALPKMIWKYENATTTSSISGVLVSGNTYTFTTPAFTCGSRVLFGFSARIGPTGGLCTSPSALPQQWYAAVATSINLILWADYFETDQSWTTSSSGTTTGLWTRGAPNAGGFNGDPLLDSDGSGKCFVTGNIEGNSLRAGNVTLTSPLLDATNAFTPYLSYSRWAVNKSTTLPTQAVMKVQLSDDNGLNWVDVETVESDGTNAGWVSRQIAVQDFVNTTNQLRVRFIASDTTGNSVVEAGVDGVRLLADDGLGWCGPQGDFNNDRVINAADLGVMLTRFGQGGITDLDNDGTTNSTDIGLWLLLLPE